MAHALPLWDISSTNCSSKASKGAGNGNKLKMAMLKLSHCQTALFGKRGGGNGGGGRSPESLPLEECSEPATH